MSYGEEEKQFISEKGAKEKTMNADAGFVLRLLQSVYNTDFY